MAAWTIVPIRGLASGKSRLAPALDATARLQLCTRMLHNTLDAVEAAFGTLAHCIVVSGDAAARSLAAGRGARTVCDPVGAGLDGALDAARTAARAAGATRLLVLSADMPDLDPAALQALLQCAAPAQPVLLADKFGTGTNGMLVPAGLPLSFAFGTDSLRRHRDALAALGIDATCCADPRLAFDIDTPADLDAWRRSGAAQRVPHAPSGGHPRLPASARGVNPTAQPAAGAPPAGRCRAP